ncbi:MAG: hypothetical protein LBR26_17710, partial [Prevotella sp.]|nr:hypothetical protein [Prevotella sp.]
SGTLTKTIIVTQPSSVSRFSVADALDEYPDDGSPQTLEVSSDCDWYVKLNFGHGIVASFDTGGSGDGTFHFSLIDNDPVVVYGRPCATFVFYSPTGEFAPVSRTVKLPATAWDYNPAVHDGWAGSNIYWDGSKLTFDDVGDTTHQYYQGLHFKWGSLYGYGYNSVNNSGCTYVPDPASATGWSVDTGLDWNNIPYADGDFGGFFFNSALYGIHEPSAGKGDICRYITEANGGALHGRKWRMPVNSEFAGWKNSSGSFDDVSGMVDSADGTWVNSANDNPGWTLEHNGKEAFFPASGVYAGMLTVVGPNGIYWMSNAYYSYSYYLIFFSYEIRVDEVYNMRAFSFSVRCVREQ